MLWLDLWWHYTDLRKSSRPNHDVNQLPDNKLNFTFGPGVGKKIFVHRTDHRYVFGFTIVHQSNNVEIGNGKCQVGDVHIVIVIAHKLSSSDKALADKVG